MPITYIVDQHTNVLAASFITLQSGEGVQNSFVMCWASLYNGIQIKFKLDKGGQNSYQDWFEMAPKL